MAGFLTILNGRANCHGWMREAGFKEARVELFCGPDSTVIGFKQAVERRRARHERFNGHWLLLLGQMPP